MRPGSGRSGRALSGNGWDRRRWYRWTEVVELGPRFRRDRVAETVEPGAGIEVLASGRDVHQRRLMGVTHDDEPEVRLPREELGGPLMLAHRRLTQLRGVHGVIAQTR